MMGWDVWLCLIMRVWKREEVDPGDTELTAMTKQHHSRSETFFYTGVEPFLKLTQLQQLAPNELEIERVFYLDPQLSVIDVSKKKESGWEQLQQPTQPEEGAKVHYLIQEEVGMELYSKTYDRYEELSDFIIGREFWGRPCNSLRIHNDLVSRTHTKILCNSLRRQQEQKELGAAIEAAKAKAHWSDKIRKIPDHLWSKVLEYAVSASLYAVVDCGSRNHTYLIDESVEVVRVRSGRSYEFENKDYSLRVEEIVKGEAYEVAMRVGNFEADWEAKNEFNPHLYKTVFLPSCSSLFELNDTQ